MDNLEETLGNLGLEERVNITISGYHDIRISGYQDVSHNWNHRTGCPEETARGEARGRKRPGAAT